jgi:spectinomycin phosphotransferase
MHRYDELAAELAASADAWVVTHGEPGSANVIRTRGGSMHLIDWDTVAVAPRERDLVLILDGSAEVLAVYQRTAGPVTPRPAALELFTLWWALADICEFVQLFRHLHDDSADTAESWRSLCHKAERVFAQPCRDRCDGWSWTTRGRRNDWETVYFPSIPASVLLVSLSQ